MEMTTINVGSDDEEEVVTLWSNFVNTGGEDFEEGDYEDDEDDGDGGCYGGDKGR